MITREALRSMSFTRAGGAYFFEGGTWNMAADFKTDTLFHTEAVRGHVSFTVPENFA